MADRGIDVVRAHLAKLPPSDSLTVAERRAQYERAEKVFPTPADVKVERVSAPAAPAEWLRPPARGAGARRALPPRRRLRDRLAALASPSGRGHRARPASAAALLLDYRLAPEHPFPAAVDDAAAAYRWLLDQGIAPGPASSIAGDSAGGGLTVATLLALRDARAAPARRRRLHLAVGRPHLQRRQLRDAGPAPIRSCSRDGVEEMARPTSAPRDRTDPAGLAALRRPARPAAAADPGGQRRGAARRRDRARPSARGRRAWTPRSRCGTA